MPWALQRIFYAIGYADTKDDAKKNVKQIANEVEQDPIVKRNISKGIEAEPQVFANPNNHWRNVSCNRFRGIQESVRRLLVARRISYLVGDILALPLSPNIKFSLAILTNVVDWFPSNMFEIVEQYHYEDLPNEVQLQILREKKKQVKRLIDVINTIMTPNGVIIATVPHELRDNEPLTSQVFDKVHYVNQLKQLID